MSLLRATVRLRSMPMPFDAGPGAGKCLPRRLAPELISQTLADVRDDLGDDFARCRFADDAGRLVAYVVMHHERVAQLVERCLVLRAAVGVVVLQHALDDARVEQTHLAKRGHARDLAVD